jgi:hypothetical protein
MTPLPSQRKGRPRPPSDQFALNRPLPDRYAADTAGSVFGRKRR